MFFSLTSLTLALHHFDEMTFSGFDETFVDETTCHGANKFDTFFRAFYGWLAHCRHLRTVRTHLGGLAFHDPIVIEDPAWCRCYKTLLLPNC
jgi:hypothetical protein